MSLYETLALGENQFKEDKIPIYHEGRLIWDVDKFKDTPIIIPSSLEELEKEELEALKRADNF